MLLLGLHSTAPFDTSNVPKRTPSRITTNSMSARRSDRSGMLKVTECAMARSHQVARPKQTPHPFGCAPCIAGVSLADCAVRRLLLTGMLQASIMAGLRMRAGDGKRLLLRVLAGTSLDAGCVGEAGSLLDSSENCSSVWQRHTTRFKLKMEGNQ